MSATTVKCAEEMVQWVEMGKTLVPSFWMIQYPRNTVSAAIRHLKKEGKIAVLYVSAAGSNVYCSNR